MDQNNLNLYTATFVGIDCHPTEHTALAINRFEEIKGSLRFENTKDGIKTLLSWLAQTDSQNDNVVVGVEGGGSSRQVLLSQLLESYPRVYEVNPLFTKQRRSFGTRTDKSDPLDAKLIATVLTTKLGQLPRITKEELTNSMLSLKKMVWFYEEVTVRGSAIQNQLHQLSREQALNTGTGKEVIPLDFIFKSKQQELARIRQTQKQCVVKLRELLLNQGANLTSMKGVAVVLAAKIVAHSGGINRFKNINDFIQYAGIAPKEKSSGKTKRHVNNQTGNRNLNHAFYLAALLQLQWNKKAKAYFEKKLSEGKTKKHALRCLMKRTACIIYGLLKSGENYRE